MQTSNELWTKIQEFLQKNLSKPSYETWIRPVRFGGFKDGNLTLFAPNSFSSDWLRKNYSQMIEEVAGKIHGNPVRVKVQVNNQEIAETHTDLKAINILDKDLQGNKASELKKSNQLYQEIKPKQKQSGLNLRYVFNRFVVGANSRMAHAAAMAVAEAPGREFNPLFICGGVG